MSVRPTNSVGNCNVLTIEPRDAHRVGRRGTSFGTLVLAVERHHVLACGGRNHVSPIVSRRRSSPSF